MKENKGALLKRKNAIVDQIHALGDMRRGSIIEQYYKAKKKDGTRVKRGPYFLYTYKDKNHTHSRRIKKKQVADYRKQIETYRRFTDLVQELIAVSEQLSDLSSFEGEDEKKT